MSQNEDSLLREGEELDAPSEFSEGEKEGELPFLPVNPIEPPKPGDQTSSYKLMLLALIVPLLSLLVTLAVSAGWIAPNLEGPVREIVAQFGLILTGVASAAWGVMGTAFVVQRGRVSQIKATNEGAFARAIFAPQAALNYDGEQPRGAARADGIPTGIPFGASGWQMTLMFVLPTLDGLAAMLEIRGKKGKNVGRIIRTATAALREYMKNPD